MTRTPSHAGQTTTRRRPTCRPQAEALEGRRLLSAGDLDPTFGSVGYVVTSPRNENKRTGYTEDHAYAVQIQGDGKILAAGYAYKLATGASSDFGLVRLNTNGSPDSTFGTGGRLTTDFFWNDELHDMKLDASGRIVVVGRVRKQTTVKVGKQTTTTYDSDIGLVRYLPTNGALDNSFGAGGKVGTNISTYATSDEYNRYDSPNALAIYPTTGSLWDGKIVVVGTTKTDDGSGTRGNSSVLLRFDPSGALDPSFGQGGMVVGRVTTGQESLTDVAIQADGKIVAAGWWRNPDNTFTTFVERYEANGDLDSAFGSGGVTTIVANNALVLFPSVELQPGGGIVVASTSSNGVDQDVTLARLTASGAPDTTFGGTGLVIVDRGSNEYADDVALQVDGKIVVTGYLAPTGGQADSFVARFNSDGSLDSGFGNNGFTVQSFSGTDGYDQLRALTLQPDGKIVAVGSAGVPTQAGNWQNDFVIARFQGDTAPLLTTATAPTPVLQTLTASQARPALTRALAYWRAHGEDTSRLGRIDLVIADLGGNRLGEASGSTITLDDNAVGWGWSVGRGRRSAGRLDLLTALEHEVGHLLGHDHVEGGVMAQTLAPGRVLVRGPLQLAAKALRGRHRAPARG